MSTILRSMLLACCAAMLLIANSSYFGVFQSVNAELQGTAANHHDVMQFSP